MKVDNIIKDKAGNEIILPDSINILSTEYNIEYYDNPTECSGNNSAVCAMIDYIDRTIRIHKLSHFQYSEIMKTLLHEIFHGIINDLSIVELNDHEKEESIIDQLSVGLIDTMIRNNLINVVFKSGKK